MVSVPEWLAVGLVTTAGLAVLFALLFVAGERLFPTAPVERGESTGEWKRRGEIREYLDLIGERYAEDHVVAGQHVAFYLPSRDVAITFDAQAYFRIEKTPTYAILVEHEMPGAHLGARLPFETPEASWDAEEDETDPVDVAFDTLGLRPDAPAEEVKAAYRERVKRVHPDHGGDEESFKRLREAYTAAKRRAN